MMDHCTSGVEPNEKDATDLIKHKYGTWIRASSPTKERFSHHGKNSNNIRKSTPGGKERQESQDPLKDSGGTATNNGEIATQLPPVPPKGKEKMTADPQQVLADCQGGKSSDLHPRFQAVNEGEKSGTKSMPDPSKSIDVSPGNRGCNLAAAVGKEPVDLNTKMAKIGVIEGAKSMAMDIESTGLNNFPVEPGPTKNGYGDKNIDTGLSFVKHVEVGLKSSMDGVGQPSETNDQSLDHATPCIVVSYDRVKTPKWKRQARSKGLLCASSEAELACSKRQYVESNLVADRNNGGRRAGSGADQGQGSGGVNESRGGVNGGSGGVEAPVSKVASVTGNDLSMDSNKENSNPVVPCVLIDKGKTVLKEVNKREVLGLVEENILSNESKASLGEGDCYSEGSLTGLGAVEGIRSFVNIGAVVDFSEHCEEVGDIWSRAAVFLDSFSVSVDSSCSAPGLNSAVGLSK
ncbi:hypothetical protein ACOSP7_010966 [Xanthoceras sorbifolium]